MRQFLLISLFSLVLLPVFGQQKVKCEGTYPYTYSESMSHAEAKARAVENAIISALADEFGTTVTSEALSEITDTSDRFAQMSRLYVKGKLLRHIHEPKISAPLFGDNLFTINVTVSFYAQAIEYAPVEFEVKVLRNGMDGRFESNRFVAGDDFYMSFKSPKTGWLAIFFEGCDDVNCILPYWGEDEQPFQVEKGKKYVLFNVDENKYSMNCESEPEINYVHVIFSPNKFIGDDLEREMTCKRFRKWLDKRQSYDNQMQVETMMIRVNPK